MIYEITNDQTAINWGATNRERIAQNVRNLLKLYRYEIPYARTKGLSPDLIDRPLQDFKSRCAAEVSNLITLYEPFAALQQVIVDGDQKTGDIFIKVVVEIE